MTVIGHGQLATTIEWYNPVTSFSSDSVFYHPGSKLDWRDFRGQPDKNSVAAAITASGFGYAMSMLSSNHKSTLVVTVNCFFLRQHSWVKPGMNTSYALLHEQHHFDITYIAFHSFLKKLRTAVFTLGNYEALLEKFNSECYSDLEKMQNQYDGETMNGQLKDMQATWNKKIDAQLAALIINSR